jgi:hypothetical protein
VEEQARLDELLDDPKSFILQRARSEVYLLLDFVSASTDSTIANVDERSLPPGLPPNWVEEVCKITWPPEDAEDKADLAKEAALLLRARDHLNRLAKPASGATLAFTLLVTQEETARTLALRDDAPQPDSRSRSSLAREAYPDLVARANGFRFVLKLLVGISLVALAFTLFFSWYLAVANASLTDYATARTHLRAAEAQVSTAESSLNGDTTGQAPQTGQQQQTAPAQQPQTTPIPQTQAPAATGSAADKVYDLNACDSKMHNGAYPSAALRDACLTLAHEQESFDTVVAGLRGWTRVADPATAAWIANVLGSAVLPVLYGFLGAIAAVVRSLSRKIRGSLLSPRDAQLSIQQLALGALIGACISLFIGGPGNATNNPSLLGPVGLSAAAIAFVAGFGVDSVFQAIEALISRLFNIAPAGTASNANGSTRPGGPTG